MTLDDDSCSTDYEKLQEAGISIGKGRSPIRDWTDGKAIPLYTELCHKLGEDINTAILLQQFCFLSSFAVTKNFWFYKSIKMLGEETCLSRYQQNRSIKKLISLGLIEFRLSRTKFGYGYARFFRVNFINLERFLEGRGYDSCMGLNDLM